jgi:hypothetical protein
MITGISPLSARTCSFGAGPRRIHTRFRNGVFAPLRVYKALWEWTRAELAMQLTVTELTHVASDLRSKLDSIGAELDSVNWETLKIRARLLLDVSVDPLALNHETADGRCVTRCCV